MPKGAKVTFDSHSRDQSKRKPRTQKSAFARERRAHSSSDDVYRKKPNVTPRAKATHYEAQHGWLTPWKKIPYPVAPAPTLRESALIEKWKLDQKKVREGPLFVRRVVDSNARVGKSKYTFGTQSGSGSAFNALPTYTARYERKYRQRPNWTGKLWRMCPIHFHLCC
jgi:hypothetical protein